LSKFKYGFGLASFYQREKFFKGGGQYLDFFHL